MLFCGVPASTAEARTPSQWRPRTVEAAPLSGMIHNYYWGRMNFYKRNLGDFAKDTADLSALEVGIYDLLLDYYYATEKPLPDNAERLCRIGRALHWREKVAVERVANRFFPVCEDGFRHHKRVDHELELLGMKKVTNSNLARLRWEREKSNKIKETSMPIASRSHQIGNATPDSRLQTPESSSLRSEDERHGLLTQPLSSAPKFNGIEVKTVFEHWRTIMGHPNAKLDAKREKAVKGRLLNGYSIDQLKQAVDGCKNSPHHMGENDRHTVYDDIELICRDAAHVDKFIKLASANPAKQSLTSQGRRAVSAGEQWLREQQQKREVNGHD